MPLFLEGLFDSEELHMLNRGHRNGLFSCNCCGPFGERPTTVANTCAPSVCEWYHTRPPGENILGLKKEHDTLYTAFGERISNLQNRK